MYVYPHFYMKEFPLSDYKKVLRQYAEVNEAIPRLWSVNLIYGMKDFLRRNWCFFFPLRHLHASSKWVSYSSKWICGIYTEIECMFVLSKALTSPVVHLSSWKWELCQEYSPFFFGFVLVNGNAIIAVWRTALFMFISGTGYHCDLSRGPAERNYG